MFVRQITPSLPPYRCPHEKHIKDRHVYPHENLYFLFLFFVRIMTVGNSTPLVSLKKEGEGEIHLRINKELEGHTHTHTHTQNGSPPRSLAHVSYTQKETSFPNGGPSKW